MSNIGAVLGWKFNHQSGMSTADGVITDFPGGIPSDEDIAKWKAEYDAHVVATSYIGKRVDAYPSIGDQLDALWKGGDNADAMKVLVNKVKSDFPKP